MLKELLSVSNFQNFSAVALAIFFLFTVAVTIWIYRPNSKKTYKKIANDPLND